MNSLRMSLFIPASDDAPKNSSTHSMHSCSNELFFAKSILRAIWNKFFTLEWFFLDFDITITLLVGADFRFQVDNQSH